MTDYAKKKLEKVRRRIEKDDDLHREDEELIQEFDLLLNYDSVNDYRHAQVLSYVYQTAARCDAHNARLSELMDSKESVKQVLEWIESGEYNDEEDNKLYEFGERSKAHYRSSLRKFGKVLNEGDLPSAMEIIYGGVKTKISSTAPKPGEILLWNEDVVPLLTSCKNPRDRALIAVAWDSGARPFEIRDLTYGDISPDGDFVKITVGGKNTPLRDPRLVIASPFLKYWLEKGHPANNEGEKFTSETPIWTHLDEVKSLSTGRFEDISPRVVAPRTEVEKPTNLRHFRKSRASVLASREEIDRGDLEERQGWAKGSRIVAVYIARYGSGADDKVARSDGLDEQFIPDSEHRELTDPAPVRCPNCSRWTPSYDSECIWCLTSFNPEAAREADHRKIESSVKQDARRDLIEMVTNGEISEDDIESARELADVTRRYPEILDYADKLQEFLNQYKVENDEDNEDEKDEDDEDEDEGGVGTMPTTD